MSLMIWIGFLAAAVALMIYLCADRPELAAEEEN